MKNKVRKILMILSCLISLSFTLSAQNPYLPLWEFIPDGEPYVFEDPDCPGKYRVYIYGSHDNLKALTVPLHSLMLAYPLIAFLYRPNHLY